MHDRRDTSCRSAATGVRGRSHGACRHPRGRVVDDDRGGIDLNLSLEALLENVRGYLDAGLDGVKIKVGLPALADDVRRVAVMRSLVGDDIALMVDANHAMDVPRAIAACRAFAPFDLSWLDRR